MPIRKVPFATEEFYHNYIGRAYTNYIGRAYNYIGRAYVKLIPNKTFLTQGGFLVYADAIVKIF